jgi:hypothetical protein
VLVRSRTARGELTAPFVITSTERSGVKAYAHAIELKLGPATRVCGRARALPLRSCRRERSLPEGKGER